MELCRDEAPMRLDTRGRPSQSLGVHFPGKGRVRLHEKVDFIVLLSQAYGLASGMKTPHANRLGQL